MSEPSGSARSDQTADLRLIGTERRSLSRQLPYRGRLLRAVIVAGAVLVLVVLPRSRAVTVDGILLLADLFLIGCAVFRLTIVLTGRQMPQDAVAEDPEPLPGYTVLVPLYGEGNVVARLVRHLSTMDYPVGSVQILLLCEQDDEDTLAAMDQLGLTEPFRLVVCPPGSPRTKARACNIGLRYASGELCVIYDAEDRPERDQLRRAAAAFARAPSRVACLQATLDFHNRTVNWLTRCFTLEYGTLFGLVLPGLTWWGLPVPLGGTSNHFRTRVLSELGGWDPYNVTEDAELGLRLHAAGYRTAMLPSTTLEEACAFAAPWLRQRTRWMKGYLQTWIVHTRHNGTSRPGRLAVHAVIGSTVLAVALLPALLVALALLPTPLWPDSVVGRAVLATVTAAAVGTFVTGQLVGAWLAPVPVGRGRSVRTLAMLPLYALLVSTATYRSGWQLCNRPHLWEKTPHGLSGADTDPAGP